MIAGKVEWKKLATERINQMVKVLPVAHMVEALLTLLGQKEPGPPHWLKENAGRMLSKLVMRRGGVAASMERLVGGIQEVSTSVEIACYDDLFVSSTY